MLLRRREAGSEPAPVNRLVISSADSNTGSFGIPKTVALGKHEGPKVCDVRRITIRRDGQVLNTKHLILTFSTPDLPQTVKMAYIRCPVRPYIPNPLRCFQIGKTFASVSSSDSYSPAFQATKNRLERTPINFRCRQPFPYNCDFDMFALKRALSSAHNTSPGPDGISYVLLRHLSEDSLASLYVDDLQISCEGSDMRLIERQLQTAVNNIVKWCDTNGHSISASKSCCVHFCRKRGIHPDPEIRIRDIQIPVVPDVRFLGVIFDRRLTFLPHILHLRKRCEKSLNLLKVLSNTSWGADRTSLLRVYQAIVLSRIDYGCVVIRISVQLYSAKNLTPSTI
ncbi:uncharacterized protein TNCV_4686651, partial [Trichonephila clavipes]